MSLASQLEQILADLWQVGSESSLMMGAIILLISGLLSKRVLLHKVIYLITLGCAFIFSFRQLGGGAVLSSSLFLSQPHIPFQLLLILSLSLILIYPRNEKHSTEFYFLLLALGVGAIFMTKANSLLIIYLCIELVSFVSYVLTGFSFKNKGHEAAIKYLLFGATSSAFLLFGIGLLYGTTGTIYISDWDFGTFDTLLSQVGMLFLLFGVFFKIAVFPFHAWTPASYQEAPLDAVAIISIVPKVAGLLLLKSILINASLATDHWIIILCFFLGMITILVGTLGALKQQNVRRMISFGAIAHSGFLLPFALIVGDTSEQAFWLYTVVYTLMNLVVFFLVERFESKGIFSTSDFGKVSREVFMGVIFAFVLISLAGLPPLAGFTAKFFLFSTLWEHYVLMGSNYILGYLVISVLATVASVFYYFRIPYFQFIASTQENSATSRFSISTKIIATIFGIALLLLFFAPKLIATFHTLLKMRS